LKRKHSHTQLVDDGEKLEGNCAGEGAINTTPSKTKDSSKDMASDLSLRNCIPTPKALDPERVMRLQYIKNAKRKRKDRDGGEYVTSKGSKKKRKDSMRAE